MLPLGTLPSDSFGVHVGNDIDERKLVWLFSQIGEAKIRKSAEKYKAKYGDLIYISRLLDWYGKKVPSKFYTEKYLPEYCVYILCCRDYPIIKLGHSGNWLSRSFSFLKSGSYEANVLFDVPATFDIERSCSFCTGSKEMALRTERLAKNRFAAFNVQPPFESKLKGYAVEKSTEWFAQCVFDDLFNDFRHATCAIEALEDLPRIQTLRQALDNYVENT